MYTFLSQWKLYSCNSNTPAKHQLCHDAEIICSLKDDPAGGMRMIDAHLHHHSVEHW